MRRVLVIDDDPAIRSIITEILADEGYDVAAATNGEEALGHLKRSSEAPPGLILLDLLMPVMDGLRFLDRYAAEPDLPVVPVVVLSANLATTGVHRSDVLLYLRKPIDMDRLLETVGRWCADDGDVPPRGDRATGYC